MTKTKPTLRPLLLLLLFFSVGCSVWAAHSASECIFSPKTEGQIRTDSTATGTINGIVLDTRGMPAVGIRIELEGLGRHALSDRDGRFLLADLPAGTHRLKASMIGAADIAERVAVENGKTTEIRLRFSEGSAQLQEVAVVGKTDAAQMRESPRAVSLIDARQFHGRALSSADLLNTVVGVQVRQGGGLGRKADFAINGMSGSQVRFFVDGIPLEQYGAGLDPSALPPQLLARAEVYKGTVPAQLGADALGGAINLVTRNETADYTDMSYSLGSFNTHKGNLNGRRYLQNGLYVGFNGYLNHSDNDYKVTAEVIQPDGSLDTMRVRRFHDRFRNYLARAEVGYRNVPWADQAFLSYSISGIDKQLQHGAHMRQPFAFARTDARSHNLLARFRKRDLLPTVGVEMFATANLSDIHSVDTSRNAYNWLGELVGRRHTGAEISASGNLLTMNDRHFSGQASAAWRMDGRNTLTAVAQGAFFRRTGEDPVVAAYYGQDYFRYPSRLNKFIGSLAYEGRFFGERLSSATTVKFYHYRAEGFSQQGSGYAPDGSDKSKIGLGQAFAWRVRPSVLAKFSYEYATRIPDVSELFGDFMLLKPNPALRPEVSHNANLGLSYTSPRLSAGMNGFLRSTADIIWRRPSMLFSISQNLLKARSAGVEAEISYSLPANLSITGSATWQDIRNRTDQDVEGFRSAKYMNARIPNKPYLFGNAEMRYSFVRKGQLSPAAQFWIGGNYVHEFFLFWEGDGQREGKNVIPTQTVAHLGGSYFLAGGRYAINAEARNLFDRDVFDEFRLQKPGRSLYLTLRASL